MRDQDHFLWGVLAVTMVSNILFGKAFFPMNAFITNEEVSLISLFFQNIFYKFDNVGTSPTWKTERHGYVFSCLGGISFYLTTLSSSRNITLFDAYRYVSGSVASTKFLMPRLFKISFPTLKALFSKRVIHSWFYLLFLCRMKTFSLYVVIL